MSNVDYDVLRQLEELRRLIVELEHRAIGHQPPGHLHQDARSGTGGLPRCPTCGRLDRSVQTVTDY